MQHLPQFVTHALVYSCCASVSPASLTPLLNISPHSHLPLLSMRRRASVVIKLRCGRAKKNNERQCQRGKKRDFISLDVTRVFAGKEPKQCVWPPMSVVPAENADYHVNGNIPLASALKKPHLEYCLIQIMQYAVHVNVATVCHTLSYH